MDNLEGKLENAAVIAPGENWESPSIAYDIDMYAMLSNFVPELDSEKSQGPNTQNPT